MPVVMAAVDVPTALFNKVFKPAKCNGSFSGLEPADRRVNGGKHFEQTWGRIASTASELLNSSCSAQREEVASQRRDSANSGKSVETSDNICVTAQALGRDERVSFYNRGLTSLPCVHNQGAASCHGDGNCAVAKARMLHLSQNNITSLCGAASSLRDERPIELASFTRVVVLDVSHNKLLSLSGVEAMTSLQVLHASHNKLRDILPLFTPNSGLQQSGTLRVLDVSFNRIDTLPSAATAVECCPLSSLRTLSLSCNYLKRIDSLTELFPGLLELSVVRNQITEAPSALPKGVRLFNIGQNYLNKDAVYKFCELRRQRHCFMKINFGKQRTSPPNLLNRFNDDDDEDKKEEKNNSVSAAVHSAEANFVRSAEEESCPGTSDDVLAVCGDNLGTVALCGAAKEQISDEYFAPQRATPHDISSPAFPLALFAKNAEWLAQRDPQAINALVCCLTHAAMRLFAGATRRSFPPVHAVLNAIEVLRAARYIFFVRPAPFQLKLAVKDVDARDTAPYDELHAFSRPSSSSSSQLKLETIEEAVGECCNNNNHDVNNNNENDNNNDNDKQEEGLKAVENVESDGSWAEKQQNERFNQPKYVAVTYPATARPLETRKHLLRSVMFSREWLIDELRAPLKWTRRQQLW